VEGKEEGSGREGRGEGKGGEGRGKRSLAPALPPKYFTLEPPLLTRRCKPLVFAFYHC